MAIRNRVIFGSKFTAILNANGKDLDFPIGISNKGVEGIEMIMDHFYDEQIIRLVSRKIAQIESRVSKVELNAEDHTLKIFGKDHNVLGHVNINHKGDNSIEFESYNKGLDADGNENGLAKEIEYIFEPYYEKTDGDVDALHITQNEIDDLMVNRYDIDKSEYTDGLEVYYLPDNINLKYHKDASDNYHLLFKNNSGETFYYEELDESSRPNGLKTNEYSKLSLHKMHKLDGDKFTEVADRYFALDKDVSITFAKDSVDKDKLFFELVPNANDLNFDSGFSFFQKQFNGEADNGTYSKKQINSDGDIVTIGSEGYLKFGNEFSVLQTYEGKDNMVFDPTHASDGFYELKQYNLITKSFNDIAKKYFWKDGSDYKLFDDHHVMFEHEGRNGYFTEKNHDGVYRFSTYDKDTHAFTEMPGVYTYDKSLKSYEKVETALPSDWDSNADFLEVYQGAIGFYRERDGDFAGKGIFQFTRLSDSQASKVSFVKDLTDPNAP